MAYEPTAAEVTKITDMVLRKLGAHRYPDSSDYHDLVSDAHLGIAQAAQRYNPTGGLAFTSYAYLRARGAVVDGMRTRGITRRDTAHGIARDHPKYAARFPASWDAIADALGDAAHTTAPDEYARVDDADELDQLLAACTPAGRHALVAHYVHGYTLEEISAARGQGPTAAYASKARALKSIRDRHPRRP